MRSKKTLRNIVFSLFSEVILLLFGLVFPRLIIQHFGSGVNGLTTTITQILDVLKLMSAGAAGAYIYSLYVPIMENDSSKISNIMAAAQRYFFKISVAFAICFVAVAPVLAFMKNDEEVSFVTILLAVIILGVNGVINFVIVSWFDVFFSAHQDRFYLSIASVVEKIGYYFLLFIVLQFDTSPLCMYLAMLAGTVLKCRYLFVSFKRKFTLCKYDKSKESGRVGRDKNTNYLMVTQISTHIINACPSVVLSFFYPLSIISVYSVYHLVQNALLMLINSISYSVSASLGNLITDGNKERIKSVFGVMQYSFITLGMFLCSCAAFLYPKFISVYVSGITDVDYQRPVLTLSILLCTLAMSFHAPFYQITNNYGLFRNTWKIGLISGIISLAVAIALTSIDMSYVMFGPALYYMINFVQRVMLLKKHTNWYELKSTIIQTIVALLMLTIAFYFGYTADNICNSIIDFFAMSVITAIICGIILTIYSLLFNRRELSSLVEYARNLLRRK